MAMLLFRGIWLRPTEEVQVLVYAENETDAARYLKTLPLYWHLSIKAEDFKLIEPPKGPSPSVLMGRSTSFAGHD